MIPIRDTVRSRNYPVINTTLIIINILLFFVEISQGEAIDQFMFTYGLVPARYSIHEIAIYFSPLQQLLSFVSFMFLHGGFWHLLGNMWFLHIFGNNVEDRLGHPRYLLFYLLCGISSGLTHLFFNVHSEAPTIGASGAIAGVMGAYLVLYPRAKILTLIPIVFIPYFVELPAMIFLGIWLFIQFISATASGTGAGGIAWWAHIGGFLFGALFLKMFLLIPDQGISRKLSEATVRKTTPRLHVAQSFTSDDESNIYGVLSITPEDAIHGSSKVVTIPVGYQRKLIRVHIPPGIRDGTKIRLAGMGRKTEDGQRGDAYLLIKVQSA